MSVLKSMKLTINTPLSGQSLIEIVVAVGIIAVVLVGVSDLVTRSLGLSSFQSSKTIAINIAQNQLTYYRQKRDESPTDFFVDPQTNFSTCIGNYDLGKYNCSIVYTNVGITNGLRMTVIVRWRDGDKEIDTELSQVLARPSK